MHYMFNSDFSRVGSFFFGGREAGGLFSLCAPSPDTHSMEVGYRISVMISTPSHLTEVKNNPCGSPTRVPSVLEKLL